MLGCFTILITEISRLIWSTMPTFTTFSFPTTFIATLLPVVTLRAWYTLANVPWPRRRPSSCREMYSLRLRDCQLFGSDDDTCPYFTG
ncbi:hypothetical protein IGI04_000641 [Brassica rapa subsp. trilocularis]|uniref:Uncharacterized protein n=1 Tax=Brassica rapa subsp. trilocularis TaxID=1813537 RepID=A0ABQ7NQC2_BRACM|nr:hypothetical protein IGI04_000641 [Brassica rapa subsp. trilocularis]